MASALRRPATPLVALLLAGLWGLRAAASIAAAADGAPNALDAAQLLDRVRPMESRFVGWPWSPFEGGTHGESRRGELSELARVVAAIDTKARSRDDADALAALGRLRAVQGSWDDAAAALRLATVLRPERADLHSDYAAVLVHQGSTDDDPTRLLISIQELDRALDLDGSVLEARFNRAIALSLLGITELATSTWETYIAQESEESWRAEATTRLESLDVVTLAAQWTEDSARLATGAWRDIETLDRWAQQDIERLFEVVLFDLLPRWARSVLAGDRATERDAFADAERVADVVSRVGQDHLLSIALRQASGGSDREELARAFLDLSDVSEGLEPENCASRMAKLEDTIKQLQALRSPLQLEARRIHIRCAIGDMSTAPRAIEALSADSAGAPYQLLHARVAAVRALAASIENQLDVAVGLYRSAISLSDSRAPRRDSKHWSSLGYLAERLGRHADAWNAHTRALQTSAHLGDPTTRGLVLKGMELFLFHTGNPQLAMEMAQDMSVHGEPESSRFYWLLRLVASRSKLGDESGARSAERLATWWQLENDELMWSIDRNQLEAARTALLVQSAPAAALAAVERARLEGAPGTPESLDLAFTESQALRRLGRDVAAEEVLRSTLESLDERLPTSDDERSAFLWRHRSFYEAMVDLHADGSEGELLALTWIDWFKHRGMFADRGDDFEQYRARLENRIASTPSTVVVVAWAVLPKELLVWRIDTKGLRLSKVSYSAERLEYLVRSYRVAQELGAAEAVVKAAGLELYRVLIEPAGPLGARRRLVLIPDLFLHELPFATLPRQDGSLLGRAFELALAPSFAGPRVMPSASGSPTWSLLAIGASAGSGRTRGLADLPLAAEEARRVATLIPRSTVLVEADATPDMVLDVAPHARMLHFATHALYDSEPAGASGLLLTSRRPDEADLLEAREIARLNLAAVQLVYLSSCGIAAAGERIRGAPRTVPELTMSFLRAGAHRVAVGSSPIADEEALQQALAFYRLVFAGATPEGSLRAASREAGGMQIWLHPSKLLGPP